MTIKGIGGITPANPSSSVMRDHIEQQNRSSANPVFARDSVSLGSAYPEYETYSPRNTYASSKAPPPKLSDFYLGMSEEEVKERLTEVRAAGAKADYTGMTDAEIYDSILNRYVEAFGKDFDLAEKLRITTGTRYQEITTAFHVELRKHVGDWRVQQTANRERLYSGMTDDEIRDAIMSKYSPTVGISNKDLCRMAYEMTEVGLLGGDYFAGRVSGYIRDVHDMLSGYQPTSTFTKGPNQKWMAMLDEPADLGLMLSTYNAHKGGYNSKFFTDLDFEALMGHVFGVTMTANGFFDLSFWDKFFKDE